MNHILINNILILDQRNTNPTRKLRQYLKEDSITYPISINGKKRAMADFPSDLSKDQIEAAALEIDDIQKWLEGKNVVKIIVVPKRMVNIVVK